MSIDERIRKNLESAARQVPNATPAPIGEVKQAARRGRVVAWVGWALAGTAAIAALVFAGLNQSGPGPVAPADSPTVLATDPLVTQAAAAPEYLADTVDLGENVDFQPVENWTSVYQNALRNQGQLLELTIYGLDTSGAPVYSTLAIDQIEGVDNYVVCDWYRGGGSCGGGSVQDSNPSELASPPGSAPMIGYGSNWIEMVWHPPLNTSVVVLTVGSERQWMRPVGGVAAFGATHADGEGVSLTALDPSGAVLMERDVLADLGPTSGFVCPITIPDGSFTPPEGYPDARPGDAWYGDDDLWTVLPIDGAYGYRKSVWWSENFPGGSTESEPPITVTWNRLDVEAPPITVSNGTNAYTVDDGWFMIAGIDPQEAGCWEVTAEYKGATLSYIYEQN